MRRWIITYVSFKGSKYANSNMQIDEYAKSAEAAIEKVKRRLNLSSTAITNVDLA